MEMKFTHEERLVLKCFSAIENAEITKISVISSKLVGAHLELTYYLTSQKGKFTYGEFRTAEIGIPYSVFGEIYYADKEPEVRIAAGIGEIIINVKMRTDVPLCNI